MSRFTAETYQNEFLPIGGEEVNAVVTVTADEAAGPASGTSDAAEIVIIDTSGSMGLPGAKLRAAVHATGVAIDTIRDVLRRRRDRRCVEDRPPGHDLRGPRHLQCEGSLIQQRPELVPVGVVTG